ncbi:endonuclease domain-containing protein [Corynebacterium hiratae]|uniref:DUF559 domain-containing protein n=2 Tax=Corynebacterium TaxID=1716 RepID=A0A553G1S8_9CORY|nr:DUF559 domain-containing protein [Corynebacterium aurimucosum]MTD92116.1 DUF559 domain-containing protein [Corynebacterium aurimucosum]TRX63459.1 DUF559 domain-containing protein [Corynebacterium aurimucosum]
MRHGIVRDLSKGALATRVRRGEITRIAKGLYVWGKPEPLELLKLLQEHRPFLKTTGTTAAQVLLGEPVTFPLRLASVERMPASTFYVHSRVSVESFVTSSGIRILNPLVAMKSVSPELGIRVFESIYSSKAGRARLDSHREALKVVPVASQRMLEQAALFTDSGAEVKVAKGLKRRGLKVECNVVIGHYTWDIVLPELKVAVEINGMKFHSQQESWLRDHWKNNEGALIGWLTLRYTGHCVAHHLDYVIDQIAHARNPDFGKRYFKFIGFWHEGVLPPKPKPWEYSEPLGCLPPDLPEPPDYPEPPGFPQPPNCPR